MKIIRFFTHFILLAILLLIAVNAIFSGMWQFGEQPIQILLTTYVIPAHLLAIPIVWRAIWLAVLLLIILYWVTSLAIWRRRPKALQVRTADGEDMLIHPGALLKFVQLQVEGHPAVTSQKVKVRQRGTRGLSILIWVDVQPIDSLPTIKRQIEKSVRDGFSQIMGIEKLDEVTIIIGLDKKNLTRRPGAQGSASPQPEPPTHGRLEDRTDELMPEDQEKI
jgi:hypothetical protein